MALHVIELNDSAITAANESGIVASSPGFALAEGDKLQLGNDAERQARLQPTRAYNRYWHELSLEPLNHDNSLRHYADIAHAHLLQLAEEAGIEGDTILAVPGNFSREQLAIVLGLVRHTPIKAVGVVDAALAASVDLAEQELVIHAELQLHQVLLTRLRLQDSQLVFESTVQVPGVGGQQFMEYMMNVATTEFIQQCRFNPQHDAGSEQDLYNQLPGWLAQSSSEQKNLVMELKTANNLHSARLPRETLVSGLASHYEKISKQLKALVGSASAQLLFSNRFRGLPGFMEFMAPVGRIELIPEQALYRACLDHAGSIISGEENLHLRSALDLKKAPLQAGTVPEGPPPTHVLYRNQALAAANITIDNGAAPNGSAGALSGLQLLVDGGPGQLGTITARSGSIYIDSGDTQFLLNGQNARGSKKLKLGDRIQFAAEEDAITMIRVHDGA